MPAAMKKLCCALLRCVVRAASAAKERGMRTISALRPAGTEAAASFPPLVNVTFRDGVPEELRDRAEPAPELKCAWPVAAPRQVVMLGAVSERLVTQALVALDASSPWTQ